MPRDQVFISYSHKDERFLNELRIQLKPYLRKDVLTAWSDKETAPGSKWFEKIQAALANASVAVMLVSEAFLFSDFISEHERDPIFREAADGRMRIVWVLIRECGWQETPFKDYQSALPPEKPLAEMLPAKRARAWRKVCESIKNAGNAPKSPGTEPTSQQRTMPAVPTHLDSSASTGTQPAPLRCSPDA